MFKKTLSILMITIITLFVFTACSNGTGDVNKDGEKSEVTITVGGSTSVQPLAEELAKKFNENSPNVRIDIQGGGSGVGIKSATEGIVDIGMSSRDLKPEETGLNTFKIAVDGIAVILNPKNEITNLTKDQLFKIYTGVITNWKDVGGADAQITVVSREEGSGTRGAFIELSGIEVQEGDSKIDKTIQTAITQGSTGAVITTVSQDPNAIGYASFGATLGNSEIKTIKQDGIDITTENIYSGSYKLARPYLFLTKDEPTGAVKEFIDYVLGTEGQDLIESNHYLKAVR